MKRDIRVYEDIGSLNEGFTELLLHLLSLYPTVHIALSGGSTPQVIFDYLSDHHQTSIPWERIFFFWGDERCVPPDDKMSNYRMTNEHLLSRVEAIPKGNVFRILGENDPEQEAHCYGQLLDEQLPQQNNLPCFELVMLGLGEDGHTVSIFPDQIALWDNPNNCVVAKHPDTGMKRVTITGQIVNNARHVAFLVTGRNKAEKVEEILTRSAASADYPATLVQPSDGILYWLLDKEAGGKL